MEIERGMWEKKGETGRKREKLKEREGEEEERKRVRAKGLNVAGKVSAAAVPHFSREFGNIDMFTSVFTRSAD